MLDRASILLRQSSRALVVALAMAALAGCADLAAALPPQPTPFPTLARLPSVTPVTPSPSPPPAATPSAAAATPTATPLVATVVGDANMRSGPGVSFAVIAVVGAGSSISLQARQDGWYRVQTADGQLGWMSQQVLAVDPAIAEGVPAAQP